jgi:tetratricopeptide (TPR) repeat protein
MIRNCAVEPAPAPRSQEPAWGAPALGFAGLLLAAVFVVYFPAMRGGFLWDDDAHVTSVALRPLHGLWRIWFEAGATQQYYPVLHTAFWFEHRLWGDSPVGYHAANAALHAAAAWLLFVVLRELSFPAPRLAALVFALHPVCVESVAWISEEKNTLSAVFYLASALLYLRFDATRRRGLYSWALALFVLALLTKSVTATLPAALLLVFWWRRGRLGWRPDIVPLLPWLAIGAAAGLFTAWVEAKFIGAEGADFSFSAPERLFLAGRAIVFYLRTLVWPANLMFIYPRWSLGAGTPWPCLSLVSVLALLGLLVARARRDRGPLAGFLFFAGTLFPALGFVNVYPFLFSFVADHFQYLASIGVLVPAAWAIGRLAGRVAPGAGRACLLLAVPVALGTLSWRQCRIYRDSETLYRVTLARNPSAWLLHFNLAVSLGMGPANLSEAISEYEATVRLKPDHWRAHNNLGSALLKVPGRTADAVAEYREALRYNPSYAEAHNNLGIALEGLPGQAEEAKRELREAIRLRPDYDSAHGNLGNLLARDRGSLDEAIAEYESAARIAPGVAAYHYDLGNALSLEDGRLADAVSEYREALRLDPGYAEAHSNLGVALSRMPGRTGEAIAEYEAALKLDPASAEVHANLANALARDPSRRAEAIAEYSAAIRMEPSDPLTRYDLGILLSGSPGRLGDAVSEFEAAVRLNPDFAEAQFGLGISLAMSNRRGEARAHLERALEIRPDFALARRALDQLKATER